MGGICWQGAGSHFPVSTTAKARSWLLGREVPSGCLSQSSHCSPGEGEEAGCRSVSAGQNQALITGRLAGSVLSTMQAFPHFAARQLPSWLSGQRARLPMQETQETRVPSLGWEDSLEEEMATRSTILT